MSKHQEHSQKADADASGANASSGRAYRTSAELDAVVMAILRASPVPLGAYMIARQSRAIGAPLAPNQVYRILERLSGQVRRVEMLNAYFEASDDSPAVTSCRVCGGTQTLHLNITDDVERLCRANGFRADKVIAEVSGLCAKCRSSENVVPAKAERAGDGAQGR